MLFTEVLRYVHNKKTLKTELLYETLDTAQKNAKSIHNVIFMS